MRRWLHEPLLHFLVAGVLLFVAYTLLNRGGTDEPRAVRLTTHEVNWLSESWARQWHRSPSADELRDLVSDYLKEELLAREARELGLDKNDTIVRRRLAQKMEFLVKDTARIGDPSENELRKFYGEHIAQYQTPARITFTQIPFKSEIAARRVISANQFHSLAELGDPSLLERDFSEADEQAIASVFGPVFAAKILSLAPGQWHGPITSGYGFHLVNVRKLQAAQTRPLEGVRAQVLDDWHRFQQAAAGKLFLAGLLKKYDVTVDESIRPLIGPLLSEMR